MAGVGVGGDDRCEQVSILVGATAVARMVSNALPLKVPALVIKNARSGIVSCRKAGYRADAA